MATSELLTAYTLRWGPPLLAAVLMAMFGYRWGAKPPYMLWRTLGRGLGWSFLLCWSLGEQIVLQLGSSNLKSADWIVLPSWLALLLNVERKYESTHLFFFIHPGWTLGMGIGAFMAAVLWRRRKQSGELFSTSGSLTPLPVSEEGRKPLSLFGLIALTLTGLTLLLSAMWHLQVGYSYYHRIAWGGSDFMLVYLLLMLVSIPVLSVVSMGLGWLTHTLNRWLLAGLIVSLIFPVYSIVSIFNAGGLRLGH